MSRRRSCVCRGASDHAGRSIRLLGWLVSEMGLMLRLGDVESVIGVEALATQLLRLAVLRVLSPCPQVLGRIELDNATPLAVLRSAVRIMRVCSS